MKTEYQLLFANQSDDQKGTIYSLIRETKTLVFLHQPNSPHMYRVHKASLRVKGIKTGANGYKWDAPKAISLKLLASAPNLAVYDNGGKTLDRYTIVDLDTKQKQRSTGKMVYDFIGASETGAGFYQHGECPIGRHLGKKIPFSSLDEGLQSMVLSEYENK
jgi:hypothetical protein